MSAPPRDEVPQPMRPPTSQPPRHEPLPSPAPRGWSVSGNADNERERDLGQMFWDKMDKHFEDILKESKQAFKIKTAINITVVVIGIVLVFNAIVYSWIRGNDGWTLFSGGIGVAALISIFFYRSQDAISKAVANVSVVDMVFKSHYRAYESITDYDYKADHGLPHREFADLKSMLELLEGTTKEHVDLIEKMQLVEKDEKFNSKGSTEGKESLGTKVGE